MKRLSAFLILAVSALLLLTVIYSIVDYINNYSKIQLEETIVTGIIDGDTIIISGGERVRLSGIDTPERGKFYYAESKERLAELIDKKEVMLEREGENKDIYDRLLRYVFINSTNVNLLLVEEGYAICYFYGDSRHQEACREAEKKAIASKLGLWGNS